MTLTNDILKLDQTKYTKYIGNTHSNILNGARNQNNDLLDNYVNEMRSDQLSTSSSSIYSIDEIDLTDPIGLSRNHNNDPISDNMNNPITSSSTA